MDSWVKYLMMYLWTVKSIEYKTDEKGRTFTSISFKTSLQSKVLWVKSVSLYFGDGQARMLISHGGINKPTGEAYSFSEEIILKSYDSINGLFFDVEIRNGKMVATHPYWSAGRLMRLWDYYLNSTDTTNILLRHWNHSRSSIEELLRGLEDHLNGQRCDPFVPF